MRGIARHNANGSVDSGRNDSGHRLGWDFLCIGWRTTHCKYRRSKSYFEYIHAY